VVGIDFTALKKLCKGRRVTSTGLTEEGEEKFPKENYQTIFLIYFQLIWIHSTTMSTYVVLSILNLLEIHQKWLNAG
jgi:hypothetical protein